MRHSAPSKEITTTVRCVSTLHSSNEIFGGPKTEPNTNSSTDAKSTKNEENDEEAEGNDAGDDEPSLLEKAAEYEAKRAFTHPSANIQGDTSTGEEHEITKFQVQSLFSSLEKNRLSSYS